MEAPRPAARLVLAIEDLTSRRGRLRASTADIGPECFVRARDALAHARQVQLAFILPEAPVKAAYVELYHDKWCAERHDERRLAAPHDACIIITTWHNDYRPVRPHNSQ